MANAALFRSTPGPLLRRCEALNAAGAPAYRFSPEQGLAQLALTGCLSQTYYESAERQLGAALQLAAGAAPDFVARTAIHSRAKGFMKDMPALLAAVLSVRSGALLEAIFDRVVDSGRMLRTFVQILRSGAAGRKSLGTLPRRLVRRWLARRSDDDLFVASVGQRPSLADVVRMVHPLPATPSRGALYGYLLGRPHDRSALPPLVRAFEAFKAAPSGEPPDVPFPMLGGLDLSPAAWAEIARRAPWQTTRMNLNTFARHGVFATAGMAELVAARLADPDAIGAARAFPYQLMIARAMVDDAVPPLVAEALEQAMEIATASVPAIGGRIYLCPDVSGSMASTPATGSRRGASSKVRCIDVAALVAAAFLRRNPQAEVLPFESEVVPLRLDPRNRVLRNAEKLRRIGGGGTCLSAPLALLNGRGARGELVVFVSDNESWVDARRSAGTQTLEEWNRFQRRNPSARLVCIDIQPSRTTQAAEREDILNVGGFSDHVFELVAEFVAGRLGPGHVVAEIERVEI